MSALDDDDATEYESVYCGDCSGSGEGLFDGSTCGTCGGTGEVMQAVADDDEPGDEEMAAEDHEWSTT